MRVRLKEALLPYLDTFSGACLIRGSGEEIYSVSRGLANKDFNIPNKMDTKFDTASITKTFTAVAVLILAEQGKFALGDRITELIDLEGTKIPGEVTVEQLLNHTSGIADDAEEEDGEDYCDLFTERPNYSIRHCRDFLPLFAYKEPNFQPGTGVKYNNNAFNLLGLLIEEVTGRDAREYIRRRIFEPCGMYHSNFSAKDEVDFNRAEGYFAKKDGEGKILSWMKNIYSFPPVGTPDGGAYCTVGDLELFLRGLVGGFILGEEYTALIRAPHCDFTRETKYGTWTTGYAYEFLLGEDGKVFCMYKEGGNAGVDGITAYFPAFDITVHILSNQEGPLWKMYGAVKDVLYREARKG